MNVRALSSAENIIWRTPLSPEPAPLAAIVRESIAEQRPALLDIVRVGEVAPAEAMSLNAWQAAPQLQSLLNTYADHIYRSEPDLTRENKPLLSLWAQWYFGLQIPPLLLALLTVNTGFSLSPRHCRAEFHETGRVARFWNDIVPDPAITRLSPVERVERLISETLAPAVAALEETGEIHGKLIWSNTGYLINWCLGDMKPLLGDALANELRQHLFFSRNFTDGRENPLWRSVILRDGALARRTCCQRYRLPGVQQCGDCTLK
ncbi:siderophore-iron reductase FhuF [uncultured Pluralibacter sp.]|uniref:siderophore-iron reductase FhuF n=1 Tax=uncultured Pluralibacter sp. TaxID=1490864 RepID=UPI002619C554|nr:siderophore-iron reductase FhuF [uncultured Pluralibacter sp.]